MPYHVPPYPYPIPGYYPPPAQMVSPYPNPPPPPVYDMSIPLNGTTGPLNARRPGLNTTSTNNARNVQNSSGLGMNGASKGRSGPTVPTRSGWSYGPGIGMGGYVAPQPSGGDVVGPRLSSRRQSGNGSGSSGYSRPSSINDDVSSTASSSTSSSSRRTYTSTSSSQHPLPPRPDWAVGLAPLPNPPHGRHYHDHSTRSLPSVNATRNGNGNATGPPINMPLPSSGPLPPLHPTDFPPLTSTATPERRPLNTLGAWGNSNIRSVLVPNQEQAQLTPYPNFANNSQMHPFDESDRSFERPPPKSTELYNHKSGRRCPANSPGGMRTQDVEKDQRVKNSSLAEQLVAMSLGEQCLQAIAPAPQESSSTLTVST